MPAVHFNVTWPDGETIRYYSPSTIIYNHFRAGTSYSQSEFGERSQDAMYAASERVRERYGYACSAAADELNKIIVKLQRLKTQGIEGQVILKSFDQK
jgi:uncharacterized repeat protein (TIGR04042 family)